VGVARSAKGCFFLQILYCEHGGSSAGVRRMLDETQNSEVHRRFVEFRRMNQQVELELVKRNGFHPVAVGHYLDGRLLRDGTKAPKQVCVKNEPAENVLRVLERLRSESGGKAKSWNRRHWRDTLSVQGVWTPLTRIA
jgi:hypothetical protein